MRTRYSRKFNMGNYYFAWQKLRENKNFVKLWKKDMMLESSLSSFEKAGPLKLDFDDDDNQFCDIMLSSKREDSVDGRLGLDILERCWETLRKERGRGNLLQFLLRKVSAPEDVKRLKDWRKRMTIERTQGTNEIGAGEMENEGINIEAAVDQQQWARDIFDAVDEELEAEQSCEPIIFETFKKVFE